MHPPIPPNCENFPDSKVDSCYWFHWSTSHGYIQCALCEEAKHAMAVKPYERRVIAAVAQAAWLAEADNHSEHANRTRGSNDWDECHRNASAWQEWATALHV